MRSEFELLLANRPDHWSQLGLCRLDGRFTGRREWLTDADVADMESICLDCPVFVECLNEVVPVAVEVFAAGEWRSDEC